MKGDKRDKVEVQYDFEQARREAHDAVDRGDRVIVIAWKLHADGQQYSIRTATKDRVEQFECGYPLLPTMLVEAMNQLSRASGGGQVAGITKLHGDN